MIYIGEKGSKIYAKVWNVDSKEKYTDLRVTTSDKQEDGSYKNSSWIVRLVGKANTGMIAEGDSIVITKAKIENIYNAEQKKSWLKVIAFELENNSVDDNPFNPSQNVNELRKFATNNMSEDEEDPDALPF